jgi:AraC family transcriptional regulator
VPSTALPWSTETYGTLACGHGASLRDGAGASAIGDAGGWRQLGLFHMPAFDMAVPSLPVVRMAINLKSVAVFGGAQGDRSRRFEAAHHSVFLTPANLATRWQKAQSSCHLMLFFEPKQVLGDEALALHLPTDAPLFDLDVPELAALLDPMAAALARPQGFAQELLDSWGLQLLTAVADRCSRNARHVQALAAPHLRTVEAFVQAHLHRRLAVAEIAAACGLPASRFAKGFVRLTGRTPHQYVVAQRVARAMALLQRGRTNLPDVAKASGFASHSHMCRVLRERLGLNPNALRFTNLHETACVTRRD